MKVYLVMFKDFLALAILTTRFVQDDQRFLDIWLKYAAMSTR